MLNPHVVPPERVTGTRLAVKLADYPWEVRQAQRLRYHVFAAEMGARVPGGDRGIDFDRYDDFCHHLLVMDSSTGEVVASTRVLTDVLACLAGGFYSESEFELGGVSGLQGRILEIGRTCVHPDYRDGSAIGVLWSALAQIIEQYGTDYLMGCASVPMRDGGVLVHALMRDLRAKYLSPEALRVLPRHPVPDVTLPADVQPIMPALLKAYLRLGAWVCGEPCADEDFGVADVFVLVDVRNLNQRYARHFMRRDLHSHA